MTNYVDLDELKNRIYFQTATMDDRFTWEEILPVAEDGMRRYRMTGCAHREADRDGNLCTHCGYADPYEPQ